MIASVLTVMLGVSSITLGLMSGIVFAYANSVMPGLARAGDRTFVEACRHMNKVITNPAFLVVSNLALVATLAAAALGFLAGDFVVGVFSMVAVLAYGTTLAVTFGGNLPLNTRLISAELGDAEDYALARRNFEVTWTRLNLVRTATCIVALCSAVTALVF